MKNAAGRNVTDAKPTFTLKRGSATILKAKPVRYDKAKKLYIYNLKTKASWRLANYKISVSLGAGSTGRSVTFKLIR